VEQPETDQLTPLVADLEAVEEPIDRAAAAQALIARLEEVRDDAMRTAWRTRRAGYGLRDLSRAVGVTNARAAIVVGRE